MTESTLPERHIEAGIRIGADSTKELIGALRNITTDLSLGRGLSCVSGGSGSSYAIRVASKCNEGMTHEEYFRRLEEWIKRQESEEAEQPVDQYQELIDTLVRSGLDISPCTSCGLDVVCIPDGLPMCEDCAMKEGVEQ
jgi:hypothetical protein